MTTREALAYVAELQRVHSAKVSISQSESISQADDENSKREEEKTRLRDEKLMELLKASESKQNS